VYVNSTFIISRRQRFVVCNANLRWWRTKDLAQP